MGLRFRKSINVGGGLRINLSKSGVGYSWGTKGFRVSKGANGQVRKTVTIPGTGISYVDSSGSKNKKNNTSTKNSNNKLQSFDNNTKTRSQNLNNELISNVKFEEDEVTKQINKVRTLNIIANVCICSIILLIIGVILKILIAKTWKVKFIYEMDNDNQEKYDNINNFVTALLKNKNVWQVVGKNVNSVIKEKVGFVNKIPSYLEFNIKLNGIRFSREDVYFLPDRILIKKKNGKFFSKTYNGIDANFNTIKYPEEGFVSIDTQIDSYTYKYVNKNGEADKRYKVNPKMPVCLYGEIELNTIDGLNMLLHFSNIKLLPEIKNSFNVFVELNEKTNNNIYLDADGVDKWNNYNDEYES